MNKAVFLDRDGIINNDEGLYYIFRPADFRLNEEIIENICTLKKAGYLVIVISNQGGIAKGIYEKRDVELLNIILQEKLKIKGHLIDEIYFCPHHPDSGECICRKPNSLLIEKALARFNINASESYFIGDSKRDLEAAETSGVKGIIVPKNSNIKEICKQIIEDSNQNKN